MRGRLVGRADLLQALRLQDEWPLSSPARVAGLLGFGAQEIPPDDDQGSGDDEDGRATPDLRPVPVVAVPPRPTEERPPLSTPMWMLTGLRRFDLHPPEPDDNESAPDPVEASAVHPLEDREGLPRLDEPLPTAPLVEPHRLWPALRRSLSEERHHGLDLSALVQGLSRAHLPRQLPLRCDRRWVTDILVVWDTSVRLTPYQADFEMIFAEIGARHGGAGLRLWRLQGAPEAGFDHAAAHAGGLVLVLSDLGNLAVDDGLRVGWRRMLQGCRARGARVVAWLPHGERLVDREAAELGTMHCLVPQAIRRGPVRRGAAPVSLRWERQRLAALREALLVRASVCIQLETALLRRLRRTDAALQAEPGVESLAWSHQPVVRTSLVSRALAPEHATAYRRQFAQLTAEAQAEVFDQVAEVHGRDGRSTEMVERLIWQTYARPTMQAAHAAAVREARQWYLNLKARLLADARREGVGPADRAFAADLAARISQDEQFVQEQAEWFSSIWAASGARKVPRGLSVEQAQRARQQLTNATASLPLTSFQPVLKGGGVWLEEVSPTQTRRRSVGPAWSIGEAVVTDTSGRTERLVLDRGAVQVAPRVAAGSRVVLQCELGQLEWTNMARPAWASEWGRDRYGLYADLVVENLPQRMRYIEPGTFFMGSSDSDNRRAPDERPTHLVTLTEGFWLADTTCTQELWVAVMRKNPSHFRHEDNLPVDSVSWQDVGCFLNRLGDLLAGAPEVLLPTEAQWEYVCKSAMQLSENSSRDRSVSGLLNVGGKLRKTVEVHGHPPNAWGIFQMLGNVFEWCRDRQRNFSHRRLMNPDGGQSSEYRILKGGSWNSPFTHAEPASRRTHKKNGRNKENGFRFLIPN